MDTQLTDTLPASEDDTQVGEIRHGFEVGSYALVVPNSIRAEVLQKPNICSMPSTPDWFAGFINHRGETVPVYNLNKYLRIVDEQIPDLSWVLILDAYPTCAGILLSKPPVSIIDPEVVDASNHDLPEVIASAAVKQYQHNNKNWLEIDHKRLFMALKQQF